MDIQHHALEALHDISPLNHTFHAKNATVFVIGYDDHRTLITEYPDVYTALDTLTTEVARIDNAMPGKPLLGARAVGVLTCGWAAPISGDEIAPGQHPLRRRVRLSVIATNDLLTGSALEFQDDPDAPILDDGAATGSLRDALLDTMRAIIAYQSTSDLRDRDK